jgi:hypothetical protein
LVSEAWDGAQKLIELRTSYSAIVDSTGRPTIENVAGARPNRYCEFISDVYVPIESQNLSQQSQRQLTKA